MFDMETQRKIEEIKKRKKDEDISSTISNNPLGLTKEELRLQEQIKEYCSFALSPVERKAYEKVLMTINLNGLARTN